MAGKCHCPGYLMFVYILFKTCSSAEYTLSNQQSVDHKSIFHFLVSYLLQMLCCHLHWKKLRVVSLSTISIWKCMIDVEFVDLYVPIKQLSPHHFFLVWLHTLFRSKAHTFLLDKNQLGIHWLNFFLHTWFLWVAQKDHTLPCLIMWHSLTRKLDLFVLWICHWPILPLFQPWSMSPSLM